VAQLVEALHYKSEVRAFDSRWCHWNFSLTQSFRPHCGPGVDSASNRNEYQEYLLGGKSGRCVGLTTLPASCVDYLVIWNPQGLSKPVMGLHYHYKIKVYQLYMSLGSALTFRHRASCILGQTFHYSPENAFYVFNQQIYFII
jgi:hypothetical protein